MSTIVTLPTDVKRIWRHSFQSELDSALEQHLRTQALRGVKAALEAALVEELLTARAAALTRHGGQLADYYRSGTFVRQVITRYGPIPDLHVPKLRQQNAIRPWQILTRYQRAMPQVLDALCYLYTMGLSLRDLQEGLYVLFGSVLSRHAINRVSLAAHAPMDAWRDQPIPETPPVLILDGVWVSLQMPTGTTWVDRSGHTRQRVQAQEGVILAALGVWPDGRTAIIHYTLAPTEDTATWGQLLQELRARGLDPAAVQVVVSDGAKGMREAMRTWLPDAALQRCTVHKVRGMARYLQYQDLPTHDSTTQQVLPPERARQQRRQAISAAALAIFQAPTRAEAEQELATFRTTWAPVEPQAVTSFLWGLKHCFTFYRCARAVHPLIRSTNLIERFFREFRAKTDEIGAFPNAESCLVVFYLIMRREQAKHDDGKIAKTG